MFDKNDGLQSVLNAYLSSSISGFKNHHSDIGGYTTIAYGIAGFHIRRNKEVLLRWMELELFSSAYRSHEGGVPSANAQIYDPLSK